jgi:hypothetical protein
LGSGFVSYCPEVPLERRDVIELVPQDEGKLRDLVCFGPTTRFSTPRSGSSLAVPKLGRFLDNPPFECGQEPGLMVRPRVARDGRLRGRRARRGVRHDGSPCCSRGFRRRVSSRRCVRRARPGRASSSVAVGWFVGWRREGRSQGSSVPCGAGPPIAGTVVLRGVGWPRGWCRSGVARSVESRPGVRRRRGLP